MCCSVDICIHPPDCVGVTWPAAATIVNCRNQTPRVTWIARIRLGHQNPIEVNSTLLLLQRTAPPQSAALDSTTISRAKLGDIDAFTAIVEAYHQRCLRFARAMLRNTDDAEDMVQEAFVRLYRALPRYEERQRFESWLFQILGNVCRTANTVQHREASRFVDDEVALERVQSDDQPGRSFDHEWG